MTKLQTSHGSETANERRASGGAEVMRAWIDCEWTDYKGRLISMALVAENGAEWYQEMAFEIASCDPWVLANVVPHLSRSRPLRATDFGNELGSFLRSLGGRVEIIADWPEDIARFCDALIIGPGVRVATYDLRFSLIDANGAQSAVPHHALHDARAIRDWHLLAEVGRGRGDCFPESRK